MSCEERTCPPRGAKPRRGKAAYAEYRPGGAYQREALAFMRGQLGESRFNRIMDSRESFNKYPCVAAKLFLSVEDWNKYVWIEWHGSLEGYTRQAGEIGI